MTDEVQTTEYRNVSGHLEDLTGGRLVEAGGFVDLSDEEIRDEFNKGKLDENFIKVPEVEPEPEQQPERPELLAKAKELDIKGRNTMRNDELQTAIIAAEEDKEGEN